MKTKKQYEKITEQLEEAVELIAEWGAYASEYFQVKYDLSGDIKRLKSYAETIRMEEEDK